MEIRNFVLKAFNGNSKIEIKTSTEKCSESWKTLRNKSVVKIVAEIHEKYLWSSSLLKLQLIQLFWKLTLSEVLLEKFDHSSNWLNLWALSSRW